LKNLYVNDDLTVDKIEIDKNNEIALNPQIQYLIF
jgi:hypothetical protein